MKNLSQVTYEDAKEIILASNSYSGFFKTGKWILTDESESIGEPCKKLSGARKAYVFWFFDTNMDIDLLESDVSISFDDANFDIKFQCYLKAFELGYEVPGMISTINTYLNK